MLKLTELDYHLPEELIARRPMQPRDHSRLMVVWRSEPGRVEHRRFADLPEYLLAGDTLVFNTSTVLPARVRGMRVDTGGRIEGLYLSTEDGAWRVMLKSGSKLRPEMVVQLVDRAGERSDLGLRLVRWDEDAWVAVPIRVSDGAIEGATAVDVLSQVGLTPLPPYILGARRDAADDVDDELDRGWYQTVYASGDDAGSVAAPTAGLHFTPELMSRIVAGGVRRADVVLHVGTGTFKPVESEYVEQHPMHEEWVRVPAETLGMLEHPTGRTICVGTTSVRSIESVERPISAEDRAGGVECGTRLLITPGYQWRWTEGLITNFHPPRSTLLALVAALFPEGMGRLRPLYELAITERYRFFSYGDAMLILP